MSLLLAVKLESQGCQVFLTEKHNFEAVLSIFGAEDHPRLRMTCWGKGWLTSVYIRCCNGYGFVPAAHAYCELWQ